MQDKRSVASLPGPAATRPTIRPLVVKLKNVCSAAKYSKCPGYHIVLGATHPTVTVSSGNQSLIAHAVQY